MRTLTIAATHETAVSVTGFYALREIPTEKIDAFFGTKGRANAFFRSHGYQSASAGAAYVALLGAQYDRIIIASDYLRWHLEPGRQTNIWRMIQTSKLRYETVVTFQ